MNLSLRKEKSHEALPVGKSVGKFGGGRIRVWCIDVSSRLFMYC